MRWAAFAASQVIVKLTYSRLIFTHVISDLFFKKLINRNTQKSSHSLYRIYIENRALLRLVGDTSIPVTTSCGNKGLHTSYFVLSKICKQNKNNDLIKRPRHNYKT